MAVIPVRFKRVAAVFGEEARARLCESSGTEHSSQSLTDLSDLVDSFFEDKAGGGLGGADRDNDADDDKNGSSPETNCSDSEIKDTLKRLFGWESVHSDHDRDDKVKRKIHALVVKSLRDEGGNVSGMDLKRRLMARLRRRGLDAGLCKSKWEKNGSCPSGDYEYIDVYASGARYFVEISLAKEFTIARPTNCYLSLLNMFPQIFVGKQEEVKQLTRLMCSSMKKSMKRMDIHVPPWRRLNYMQAKWFSSYKRTTNESAASASVHHQEMLNEPKAAAAEEEAARRKKRSVGFVPVATISFLCRDDFSARAGGGGGGGGMRVGNLAAALNDNSVLS